MCTPCILPPNAGLYDPQPFQQKRTILKADRLGNSGPLRWTEMPDHKTWPDHDTIIFGDERIAITPEDLAKGVDLTPSQTSMNSLEKSVLYERQPSLFDEMVQAPPPNANAHPVCSTQFLRRIILAKVSFIVDSYLKDSLDLTVKATQNIESITQFDAEKLDQKPWQDQWRSEFFSDLWEKREDIEQLGFGMSKIRGTLKYLAESMVDIASNTEYPADQMPRSRQEHPGLWIQPQESRGKGEYEPQTISRQWQKLQRQDFNDLSQWQELEVTRKYSVEILQRTIDSYLQAAQAEGAKFANIQAVG